MEGRGNPGFEEDGLPGTGGKAGGGGGGGGGGVGVLGAVAGWRTLASSWSSSHPGALGTSSWVLGAGLYHAYFFICLGRSAWPFAGSCFHIKFGE